MGAQGSRDFPKALAIALRAPLVRIVSSALLLAPSDAGDLSSITWKKQGNVDSTETSSETSFVATSDDLTNGNYAYSEGFNVVSFKVKPNFHSTAMKTTQIGFVCDGGDGFHTDTIPGSNTFGFSTNGPFSRTMFHTNDGQSDGVDEVSLGAQTEIQLKIDGGNVSIVICTDETDASCTLQKSYAMGNLAQTSCMAKIVMSETGAGFEVLEAVTLDTTTTTATVTNTTIAAPTTILTTAGPTTTAAPNTTTADPASVGIASKALHASINWMGVFPMAMSIAAAAHIV